MYYALLEDLRVTQQHVLQQNSPIITTNGDDSSFRSQFWSQNAPHQVDIKHQSLTSTSMPRRPLQENLTKLDRMLHDLEEVEVRKDSSQLINRELQSERIPPQVLGSPDGGRRSSEGPSSPMSQKTKEAAAHASKQLDELMASLQQLKFQQQPSSDRSLSTRQRHVPSPSSQRGPLYQNASAFVEQPAVEVNSPRHQTSTDVSSSSAFPHSPNGSGAPARQTNGNSILSQSEYRGSLCQKCCQPVIGKVITALGGVWHPEHFTCAYCQKNVVHEFFYEHEGAPYCTECHLSLFAPKCAFCGEAIVDRCLETMGYFWHPEHFFCQGCHTPFVENATAHEHHGKVFCPDCYYSRCSERCGGCGRPIIDTYITALEQPWHEECFKCKDCGMNLTGQNFCTEGGSLYCEKHHRRNSGMICTACQEPITGSRCINALGKRYHPQHFVCTYCLRQLSTGTFKERLGKPYCDPCFRQLFG
uniref:Paxillin n=1 Tax=Mesocestoides corti TaxID=53468 RepID=A0A5K3F2K1_MESCO